MTSHDPFAALRLRDFRLYSIGGLLAIIGQQMQSVAVGWELYERTNSAMSLGWIGLVQALPVILLALPAGQLADRFDRRHIVIVAQVFMSLCSIGLAFFSYYKASIGLLYALLLLWGVAKAFTWPARAAMISQLVPINLFSNAATWSSTVFQVGAISGPALGGLIIAEYNSALPVYIIDAIFGVARLISMLLIKSKQTSFNKEPMTLGSLIAGFDFVWRTKIILATISLDLFAVLLGGATTLLPIFAKDILHVGPSGLGWLRAAPSIGAVLMAFVLVYSPPMRQAGKALLWSVIIFGLATIIFGFSRSFSLSFVMLFIAGAVDNISVVVRQTLVQVLTPDEMRGRVSAVNSIFITSSNEIGGFESGLVAAIFNPVVSVVSGGIGTILIVVATILIWPEVKQIGSLQELSKNK